jgi:hypothetical protein
VPGGRVFGYENVRLDGHVERRIVESEAAVVRRIFELSVAGYGMKAIAKRLNADGAPSPRSQRGRSRSWVASSVREALHRDLYRGVIAGRRAEARRFLASVLLEDPANARPIVTSLLGLARHNRADHKSEGMEDVRRRHARRSVQRTFPLGWRPRAELNCRPRA